MKKLALTGTLFFISLIAFKRAMAMAGESDKIAVSEACYRDEDEMYVAIHTSCKNEQDRTCIRTSCPPGTHS